MTEQIITNPQPTQDEVLTASLKLIVEAFTNMGYEDRIIFGKVNLILQGFITAEGKFTDEYITLAQQALDTRASKEFRESLELDNKPEGVSLIMPGGIIGGVKL
jgi:hypothetical protein